MILEYGIHSHPGKVRKSNEDYYFIPSCDDGLSNLMMVADGMGGHNAGDLASRMVVENIIEYFRRVLPDIKNLSAVKDSIYNAILEANKKVYIHSNSDVLYSGMGTTLTMVYIYDEHICVGHVGDSRCYLIRDNSLKQITKDHSLVQELLEKGRITPDEVRNHPQKNVITRALGTEESVEIDYYEMPLRNNDIILLCTDGLTQHVNLEQNLDILTSKFSLDEITTLLAKKALDEGGIDNITIAISKYSNIEGKG